MEYLQVRRNRIDSHLESVLDEVTPDELADAVRHVSLTGGKRVRPVVTVLVCEAAGGDLDDALDFAVGIELVHTASLVIDDIIDDAPLRRGVESAWAAYGYGPAIITSDGLLGEALSLFSSDNRAMETVTEAMVELGEGEATELVAEPKTESEYMTLARRKTGALFRAAAELGAIAADADPYTVEAFGQFAERVGVAFQIRDDVLDSTADTEKLGKPAGQDAVMDRPSLVQISDLSPEQANQIALDKADAALSALDAAEDIEATHDQQALGCLSDLAEFVVVRDR